MTNVESLLPTPVLDLYKACGVKPHGMLSFRETFPNSELKRYPMYFEGFYDPQFDFIALNESSQLSFARLGLHELVHWTGHHSRLARDKMLLAKVAFESGITSIRNSVSLKRMNHTEEAIAENGMIKLTKILGLWTPEIQKTYEDYLKLHDLANLNEAEKEADRAIEFILNQKQNSLDFEYGQLG